MAKPTIRIQKDSPRLLLPRTLLAVLNTLIDELGAVPDSSRVHLEASRNALCRAFRFPLPGAPTDSIQLAHELNPDEDIDAP